MCLSSGLRLGPLERRIDVYINSCVCPSPQVRTTGLAYTSCTVQSLRRWSVYVEAYRRAVLYVCIRSTYIHSQPYYTSVDCTLFVYMTHIIWYYRACYIYENKTRAISPLTCCNAFSGNLVTTGCTSPVFILYHTRSRLWLLYCQYLSDVFVGTSECVLDEHCQN